MATAISSNISTIVRPTAIFANTALSSWTAKFCPITSRSRTDWKVHHDGTDMADHAWMQREEEAFLTIRPRSSTPGISCCRKIERIDLDYFGIDCGLDVGGNLVVFEVNASMLVHDENQAISLQGSGLRCIKAAFDAMLTKFAASGD